MTNETRKGTELEQLAECKGCSALLAPNIAVSTTTPGLQFSALVFADVPCDCTWVSRTGSRTPAVNELSVMDHMFRKEWHAQGMSDTEIGRLCKVQSTTIQKWREKYGLPPNAGHAHAPAAAIAERFRLAEKGLSNREIADREGANIDAIRSWRKRNGLAS